MKFKKHFTNQFYVLKPAMLSTKYFLRDYFKACTKDIKNVFYNMKQRLVSTSLPIHDELRQTLVSSTHDSNKINITFYGAARRKDNNCCNLDKFFSSLVKNALEPSHIEVLLAIDPDDDLKYFQNLKKKFEKYFQLKIFITEKRLGYENLHLYDAILFKQIAPNTKMLADFSDDCYITLPHFDKLLLEIDQKNPDNIYFIHTQISNREEYLGDISKNIHLLYWVMQTKAPASFFPIFSKKILDIALNYAKQHDKHRQWSPLANTWICDCYIDILSTYVKRFGLNRIYMLDMIYMNPTIFSSYHYRDKQYQLTPNNIAFIKMLNNESLNYLQGLAEIIANYPNTYHKYYFLPVK